MATASRETQVLALHMREVVVVVDDVHYSALPSCQIGIRYLWVIPGFVG